MPRSAYFPTDPGTRAALTADLDSPVSDEAGRLSRFLAEAFGPSTAAIIHYGSRAQRSDARSESAFDFFVIVDDYRAAYRSLRRAVVTSYSPAMATLLAYILPPNVVSISASLADQPLHAKCAVLSVAHLASACRPGAKDHFVRGRLFQVIQLAWTRDPASRARVIDALLDARVSTFDWVRPYLPREFDTDAYCRKLLETSYAAEIRPEGGERTAVLLVAQRDALIRMYAALLEQLAGSRILLSGGNVYRLATPVGVGERLRVRRYFMRSKGRATLRWGKYVLLYEGWLPYIVQKISRRSGMEIELTPRERRWPLIFLWPKAFRYLRERPQRRLPE